MVNILEVKDVKEKLRNAESMVHSLLLGQFPGGVPEILGRDAEVKAAQFHPDKKGFTLTEGRARLMHDMASIELQALELAVRTLVEFPEAPADFRKELADVALSEAYHLSLCIEQIERAGFNWGHWPVHTALWQTVSKDDDLLDRIFIVHRYLEGSGLDAGDGLLKRLNGISENSEKKVLQIIHDDEIGHVLFGSKWFKTLCLEKRIDPEEKLKEQINRLRFVIPRRIEKIAVDARKRAGFSDGEIKILQDLREDMMSKQNPGKSLPDLRSTIAHAADHQVLS